LLASDFVAAKPFRPRVEDLEIPGGDYAALAAYVAAKIELHGDDLNSLWFARAGYDHGAMLPGGSLYLPWRLSGPASTFDEVTGWVRGNAGS
jgi:hypothetical protein